MTISPYLAICYLHELETQEDSRYPTAKGILTQMTYADDIVVGANTGAELCQRHDYIIGLLQLCGCELEKWTSNCQQLLERVPPSDRVHCLSFDPKGRLFRESSWSPLGPNSRYICLSHRPSINQIQKKDCSINYRKTI